MFEKASRLKLRFNHKGLCSVEDLWDLPLTALDSIFKVLNATLKAQKEESLLDTKSKEETVLALKIAIVKHIVEIKLAEAQARKDRIEKKEKKAKIMEIIAKKQDADLEGKSIEDLTKLMEEL